LLARLRARFDVAIYPNGGGGRCRALGAAAVACVRWFSLMENRTPISVVVAIVNYRSAELTLRALESLRSELAQPALKIRAVVVENASGDEERLSREIPQRFGDFATLVVSAKNGGFGAGNNLAIRHAFEQAAPPDYVLCLNPDTEVRTNGVLELVRFMEQHPQVGIAGSRFEHEDGSEWPVAFRFPTLLSEVEGGCVLGLVTKLLSEHTVARHMGPQPERVDWLPGASMLMRRSMLEKVGGFDESYFLYFEETDLCLRARAVGFETWHVPQSRVMHIRGQSTGVTVLNEKPKRLPGYWFESRRRYYRKNHGLAYAVLADLAALSAGCVGHTKRILKGEPHTPHWLRDIWQQSPIWSRNRTELAPERCYSPGVGVKA
jgi:N-acetylglucosaminyl-diphospho-decaprenol L-rhamnosyltransferase